MVRRHASDATIPGRLGPLSTTSTGAPSLTGNLCARNASRARIALRGEPETLLGAVMLNTSYVVVVSRRSSGASGSSATPRGVCDLALSQPRKLSLARVKSSTIKESDSIPELIRPVIVSALGSLNTGRRRHKLIPWYYALRGVRWLRWPPPARWRRPAPPIWAHATC